MKKITLFLLGIILLAGGFLRFYKVSEDPPGLYIDEVSIGLNAYDILKTGKDQYGVSFPLSFRSFGDYKMPLYIYSVSAAMSVFGKNEFAIRFPSALAGTLTLVVIFLVTKILLSFHKDTQKQADFIALLAAGVLAITPWHIHFSRGGFEVTLSVFLYFSGLFFALLFWKKKNALFILVTVIFFLLAMYTYQSSRIFIPLNFAAGVVLAIINKEHRKGLILGLVTLAILSIPLVRFTLSANGTFRLAQTSAIGQTANFSGIERYLANCLFLIKNYLSFFSITYFFRYGDQINRHQVNDLGILYVWQIPFIFGGLLTLVKTKNRILRNVIFFILIFGPIPASIVVPSPHTLRFLTGSAAYSFLTALGIYYFFVQKNKWMKYMLVGIVVFAIIEFVYYLQYYYINYPKEALIDWGGECKEIAMDLAKAKLSYQHIVIDKNLDCVPETFTFYIPQVPFTVVDVSWYKPKNWGKTLYVRTYYGNPKPDNLLYNVYLQDINKTIFAQIFAY